jgi:hypothetical protein
MSANIAINFILINMHSLSFSINYMYHGVLLKHVMKLLP